MKPPTITQIPDTLESLGCRRFRLEGGDLSGMAPRPGCVAWCEITVWNRALYDAHTGGQIRTTELGDTIASYGGEVWPSAWPALFNDTTGSAQTGPITYITPAGRAMLEAASAAYQRGA